MTTANVVQKLWGFCHVLRHDGIDYGDYIEQITFLLFLKMSEEKGQDIPKQWNWEKLKEKSGTELTDFYMDLLRNLGKEKGMLGEIYSGARSRFNNPVNLKRLIQLIDGEDWTAMKLDIKAEIYEGLLEKSASEAKKGAGQYFTPRILINSIVQLMKPNPLKDKEFTVHDPAAGTGGFLVSAYEWLISQTQGGAIPREENERIREHTYSATELVPRPRRLALMNLYLHELRGEIYLGDSIYEPDKGKRYSCILTNPPFGKKGAGQAPEREDFTVSTSNKQLNFLQHCVTILKPGGRCAIVLPDNVLFEERAASQVIKYLMEDCNLHTILRLPKGTFAPYAAGVNANVLFFTKGMKTDKIWIYDARTNGPQITKKERPLTPQHFEEFEKCFGENPNGLSERKEAERFKSFTREEIEKRKYNLDISFVKANGIEDQGPDAPEDLIQNIRDSQEKIGNYLDEMAQMLKMASPNGWESKTIDNLIKENKIVEIKPGFASGKYSRKDSQVLHLRPMNIDIAGRVSLKDCKFIEEEKKREDYLLQKGDVLFNNTNSVKLVGKTALYTEKKKSYYSNHITRIRVNEKGLSSNYLARYLHFLWLNGDYQDLCHKHVNQAGINKKDIEKIKVVLPPRHAQKKIVTQLDAFFEKQEEIKKENDKARKKLEMLPKAVLAKAFSGELVS